MCFGLPYHSIWDAQCMFGQRNHNFGTHNAILESPKYCLGSSNILKIFSLFEFIIKSLIENPLKIKIIIENPLKIKIIIENPLKIKIIIENSFNFLYPINFWDDPTFYENL